MPFSFRLQSLLNWKKGLEESAQMRVAEKGRQLCRQEDEIQRLASQRAEAGQILNAKAIEGIQVGEYLVYKDYAEENYRVLMKKEVEKEQTRKEMEEERDRLIGFMKERNMLERLKEKRLKKFITLMEKLDQKNIDEVVIQKSSSSATKNL
jgi:flagellar export protein FliJ